MTHARAIRELKRNYKWRGVWLYLRHYGLRRFVRQPSDVLIRASALSDGAFV